MDQTKNRPKSNGKILNGKIYGQFLVVTLHFLALKVQLVVLVSAFVMVSTVWSVSCLLFFYSRCPLPCKSGSTCPHALWSCATGRPPNIAHGERQKTFRRQRADPVPPNLAPSLRPWLLLDFLSVHCTE